MQVMVANEIMQEDVITLHNTVYIVGIDARRNYPAHRHKIGSIVINEIFRVHMRVSNIIS